MGNFNLENYETVDSRIKKFYVKYPDGRILTELLPSANINTAVFKAFIYNKDVLLSTGHAFEIAGQGYVNKTCHLENAETSAIGRGLANIGLNGDLRPSREEMQKADKPSLPEKPEQKANPLNLVYQTMEVCDVDKERIAKHARNLFGRKFIASENVKELNLTDIKKLCDDVKLSCGVGAKE